MSVVFETICQNMIGIFKTCILVLLFYVENNIHCKDSLSYSTFGDLGKLTIRTQFICSSAGNPPEGVPEGFGPPWHLKACKSV